MLNLQLQLVVDATLVKGGQTNESGGPRIFPLSEPCAGRRSYFVDRRRWGSIPNLRKRIFCVKFAAISMCNTPYVREQ